MGIEWSGGLELNSQWCKGILYSRPLQNSKLPLDPFLTLVCTSCLHQTPRIPSDRALHICTYSYTSPHVLLVASRSKGIISPSWILCGLPVVLFRRRTAAPFMYLVRLAEGCSSACYSLVSGTPLTSGWMDQIRRIRIEFSVDGLIGSGRL
jgi:hypothetical protein